MSRSSTAPLSPFELASLRQIDINPGHFVLRAHRDTFVDMRLIAIGKEGGLRITALGLQRLKKAQRVQWPKAVLFNPLKNPLSSA